MRRVHDTIRVAIAVGLFLLLAGTAFASPRVLVLFDGKADPAADGYTSARFIANLLGHFDARAEIQNLSQYRPGELGAYDVVFFAPSTVRADFPDGFVNEVAARTGTTVWLGRHIDAILTPGRVDKFGFSYIDYRDDEGFRSVVYKNVRLPKGDPDLNQVAVLDGSRVKVRATAQNEDGAIYPYVLQSGNFWYFADSPFSYANEGDRYLVFGDLLHDILGQPHGTAADSPRRAMVRIEDVSIDDDPQDLRNIADYLSGAGVPFQIALIPIFRDPEKGLEVYLSDRKPFTDAIHYMVSRGGSVVMHGVTHQYRGASGDDYEFWNAATDKPVPNDGQAGALDRKLALGFRECFRNGIYPIAWETPHNAGSANTYGLLKKYFTVFFERELAAPAVAAEQYFPYPVHDIFGRFVVPENLGYIPAAADRPEAAAKITAQTIVDNARSMSTVRDGIATFYFHPFMPLAELKQMVEGVRGLGYQFISLREFAPRAQFGQYEVAVASRDGSLPAPPAGSRWLHRVVIAPDGTIQDDTVRAAEAAHGAPDVKRGALVAWEPAAGPAPEKPSLWARAKAWWSSQTGSTHSPQRTRDLPVAALLWSPIAGGAGQREQQAFENLLGTYGYEVERVPVQVEKAHPFAAPGTMLVVPAAVAAGLSPQQQEMVLSHVRGGGSLVLSGRSTLAERLGLEFSSHSVPVEQVSDLEYPEVPFHWKPAVPVARFDTPEDGRPLMIDMQSRQVLVFTGTLGTGRYLYLAAPLDESSGEGIARYPYLANHLNDVFSLRPRLLRPAIEAYFDDGQRQHANAERLVGSWRKAGIRIVHVAAWKFYPRWQYDYNKLIRLCHANGIAVYAWFEPPMITEAMWDSHPEWREKTASGADGRVGWRYLMNLRNPDALRAALAFFREKIEAYDWDGVNLAELNFDSANPVMDPKKYVPMNADVRDEFRRTRGFDPVLLFDERSPYYWRANPAALRAFTDYRVELVTRLHRAFLGELAQIRKTRDLEVVVTMLDSLHSRTLRTDAGVDSRQIVELMKEYPFTLQVEDPSEFWTASPDRYREFGRTYLSLVHDPARLMFDVNVVPDRDVSHSALPSQLATGGEFARSLAAAAAPTGRAVIYSEFTVTPQDWELAASVLASAAHISPRGAGWLVEAPHAVNVRIPPAQSSVYLDGRAWPAFETGSVLVPAGRHLLTFARPSLSLVNFDELELKLRSISGELVSAAPTSRGMVFDYRSPGRCITVFNRDPYLVRIDGRETTVPALRSPANEYALVLPSGKHHVELVANGPAAFAVDATSLVFSRFIYAFGGLSCGAMLCLYAFILLRRARRPRRRANAEPGVVT